jgi:hypothetical protein
MEVLNPALVLQTTLTIVYCSAILISSPETIYLALVSLTLVVSMALALVLVILKAVRPTMSLPLPILSLQRLGWRPRLLRPVRRSRLRQQLRQLLERPLRRLLKPPPRQLLRRPRRRRLKPPLHRRQLESPRPQLRRPALQPLIHLLKLYGLARITMENTEPG